MISRLKKKLRSSLPTSRELLKRRPHSAGETARRLLLALRNDACFLSHPLGSLSANVQAPRGEGEGTGGAASGPPEPGGRAGGGERPREEAAPDGQRGQEQTEAGDVTADRREHGVFRRPWVPQVGTNLVFILFFTVFIEHEQNQISTQWKPDIILKNMNECSHFHFFKGILPLKQNKT